MESAPSPHGSGGGAAAAAGRAFVGSGGRTFYHEGELSPALVADSRSELSQRPAQHFLVQLRQLAGHARLPIAEHVTKLGEGLRESSRRLE